MSRSLLPATMVSTEEVSPDQRVAFWESYNATVLVGLRCSTFAEQGLWAQGRCFNLESLRIADLRGNEHVVERSSPMVRRYPKNSIFACLLLEGEGFVFQSGQCIPIHPGDLVIYSSDIPYLHGLTRDSRHIVVDSDTSQLLGPTSADHLKAPIKIDSHLPAGRQLARTLRTTITDFVDNPYAEEAEQVAAKCRLHLRALLSPSDHRLHGDHPDAVLWRLLRAEAFIAEHLPDPALTARSIARYMNISVRHLSRLFATRQTSVTECIWNQRLERAEGNLVSPQARTIPIGEVASRWAFANQAHFSRRFKGRYGLTPTEYRRRALGTGPS
ncbi:MAG: helix-turn-helix domain-containing protein [Steroidobacteraceae bacterium]